MNVSNLFKKNIQEWVYLDNKISEYNKKISSIKKEKDKYSKEKNLRGDNILVYMENNNLQKNDIIISDGKLKYYNSKTTESVTKKLVLNKLIDYFNGDKTKANSVANYIFDNREVTIKRVLKRTKSRTTSTKLK